MILRKKIVISFLIVFSFCFSLSGQDTLSRFQLSAGANRFPTFYFPVESYPGVLWGYHAGVLFPWREKWMWRGGLNMSYKEESFRSAFSIAINMGVERRLTSVKSKWICNIGFDLNTSFYQYNSLGFHVLGNGISVGPLFILGRDFGKRVVICSETGLDVGYFTKEYPTYINNGIGLYSYRLFSIHVRYKIFKK